MFIANNTVILHCVMKSIIKIQNCGILMSFAYIYIYNKENIDVLFC